jgi:hypothetical protein
VVRYNAESLVGSARSAKGASFRAGLIKAATLGQEPAACPGLAQVRPQAPPTPCSWTATPPVVRHAKRSSPAEA